MSNRIPAWLILVGGFIAGRQTSAPAVSATEQIRPNATQYVVYYWRAKPGMLDAYNEYIKSVAEPIDESARKAGVFEEVHTYLASAPANPSPTANPVPPANLSPADWTHVRVFKLANGGTPESLSAGLDSATKRVQRDEAMRNQNSARAAQLRDFVKQEMWAELK